MRSNLGLLRVFGFLALARLPPREVVAFGGTGANKAFGTHLKISTVGWVFGGWFFRADLEFEA